MQYVYANNEFILAEKATVPADDRSFRFGDGIFDTALVANGEAYDLESHISRLENGLKFFHIDLDISKVEKICHELIAKNNLRNGYVRIVVSRGSSKAAVGYLPGDAKPYFMVQTVEAPFPQYKKLSLIVSPHAAAMHIPCKVNSAMLYTLSMMEAQKQGCDNALILNSAGEICETASGNIFWVKDDVLHTPSSELPFVPGTLRKRILALSTLPVKEGRYTLADLQNADEIFMTNVAYLVTPIASIKGLKFSFKDDTITRQLRALVEGEISRETQAPH